MTPRLGLAAACCAALALAVAPAVRATAPDDAAACAELKAQTAVTFDKLEVDGRSIQTAGTWSAAPKTPGVMLEVRSDGDVWGSYTELGAAGTWSWSGIAPTSSRMCGNHALHVYAHPLLKRGQELVHCMGVSADVRLPYAIDCSSKGAIDTCAWSCIPNAEGGSDCDGTCTASAKGISETFVPLWSVGDTKLPRPEEATAGPWQQKLSCRSGQKVTLIVRGYSGMGAASKPVSVECGGQP